MKEHSEPSLGKKMHLKIQFITKVLKDQNKKNTKGKLEMELHYELLKTNEELVLATVHSKKILFPIVT